MEIQTINKKLIRGILTLTFRRALLYAVSFLTINIILARVMPPSVIGVFNIANSILALFSYFSDIGLAAAIIQKKELHQDDLKTTFTIQEILALIITITIWFGAPFLAPLFQLDVSHIFLIRTLGIGFFLTSLKVIPSVLLERELNFGKLVWVEILETLSFNGVLIYLAFNGFGVDGFSFAALARGFIGVMSIYIIAPWNIKFGFSKQSAKALINFGLPFQLYSLLAMLKDRLVPLVIANIVGPTGVGYITWAQNLAFVPLEVMNIIIRVTFPAFSRLQHDQKALKQTVERSIYITTLFLFPLLFGILAIAPSIVMYVVRNDWRPALPLVYLFAINTFWASLSTVFTNVLNAIGKVKTSLKLMIMWTVLTWAFTPFFTIQFGFIGVAISSAVISFTSIVPIWIIKKELNLSIFEHIAKPLLYSVIMAVIVYISSLYFVSNWQSVIGIIIFGGLIYAGFVVLFEKKRLLTIVRNQEDEVVL